ncbi:MAG: uroporphyrinogen decarboxylase family protein [Candidatus Latescibacteria bacterium]|jgi:uroporphyrinogen-III decarboxylase|nr:uroporphyrinogen decarboxylase family protein [Candidatus Latescibacterota bacterium]
MLAALDCREPDRVPCCFSAFQILNQRCADQSEFVDRQLEMGLDVVVQVSTPPPRHHPRVEISESIEDATPYPILHKRYSTPAGILTTEVHKSEDWPWGDHVPFIDDFLIPRSREFLITSEDDLEALPYLLDPPTEEDLKRLAERCRAAKELASDRGLLTAAHYGMIGDVACWLSGIEPLIMSAVDRADFVHRLLSDIEEWNSTVMDAVLEQGLDLFVRRAWYENADTWSPKQYERFILPGLRRDVEKTHAAGARFGYLMSCASLPLLDMIIDAGVDVLLGVDPAQDRTMDLQTLKEKSRGRICLWGGVCGYLTMEEGSPEDVREQVRQAVSILAPGGGFILSPVTNVREDNERVRANVDALIDEWRSLR